VFTSRSVDTDTAVRAAETTDETLEPIDPGGAVSSLLHPDTPTIAKALPNRGPRIGRSPLPGPVSEVVSRVEE